MRNSKSDETNNATKSKPEKSEKHGKKTKAGSKPKRSQSIQFLHPWLSTTLKGNSGYILGLDFSPNGKYLINTAEGNNLFIRANVELDHTTKVRFSPDTKAFIGSLGNDNTVRIFRIGKKDDGSPGNISAAFDFPKKHSAEIINIGIASNGKFIMTCSRDTTIIIWSIKGDLYTSIDTHQMNNSYGAVSPCGRFVASSGFTPDVKVWEVCFDKGGMFQDVKRAFELKGHSAVRYELGQEAYLLCTGNIQYTSPSLISLSPDGRTVVVGADNSIKKYTTVF
ncbi:hypothetical protein KUTeg_009862 [Tegillarca granosa]|uniref:Uncharacterized protein n=1 Tax=Tegillarca granosa TaxID=220873 RepID=A0ABQ9F534_TEGGR|nr:hypothetical protein KUTeg_009862 [Tegillarca granosa]